MTDDLVRVVHGARRPHGYTLATGAGVLCIDKYGLPDLGCSPSVGAFTLAARIVGEEALFLVTA